MRIVSFRTAALGVACLAGAVTMSGCRADDLTNGTNGKGSFSAAVSGDKQASLTGYAEIVSYAATSTSSATVIMGLTDQNQGVITAIQFLNTTSLAAQTYTVGPADGHIAVKLVAGDATIPGNTYNANTGTVTITSIVGKTVTGTFDVGLISDTSVHVEETGSFQAVIL